MPGSTQRTSLCATPPGGGSVNGQSQEGRILEGFIALGAKQGVDQRGPRASGIQALGEITQACHLRNFDRHPEPDTPKSAPTVPPRESWVRVVSDPRPEPKAEHERESEVAVCRLRDGPGSDPTASTASHSEAVDAA
jgi:hypothetical protein